MDHSPKCCEVKLFYENNCRLGTSEQNILTRAIIDFFNSKNVKLSVSYMENIAKQIVTIFPNESECVYFKRSPSKRAMGKLVHRYHNTKKLKPNPKIAAHIEHIEKSVRFTGNGKNKKAFFMLTIYVYL